MSCRVGAHVPPHAVHQPSCTPRWRCPARFRPTPAESAASPQARDLSAAQLRRGALRRSIVVTGLITISVSASDLASAMDPPVAYELPFRLLHARASAGITPLAFRLGHGPVPCLFRVLHGWTWRYLFGTFALSLIETEGAGSSADTGAVWPARRCRSNSTRLDSVLPARASGGSQLPQQAPPVDNVNTARPSQRSSAKIGSEYAKNSRMARTELEHPRCSHRTSVS